MFLQKHPPFLQISGSAEPFGLIFVLLLHIPIYIMMTRRLQLALLVTLLSVAVSSHAADTLALARVRSVMNIPLPSAKAVVECTVQSEFPVEGSAALRQAVDVWTRGVLADVLGDTKGGQVNESAVLSSVENRFLDCAVAEAGQAAHVKDARTLALTLDFQMTRVYETSRAITFCIDAPRYGASGQRLETRVYATFIKADGSQLTWDALLQPKAKLRQRFSRALVKNLHTYFGTMNYVDLLARTSLPKGTSELAFPLPQAAPALTRAGLRVSYSPGELAPASAGTPVALVSMNDISSCLTSAAKRLLK